MASKKKVKKTFKKVEVKTLSFLAKVKDWFTNLLK